MKDAEKHYNTKLDVEMYQLEGLLDECDDDTKLQVIGTIINGGIEGDDHEPVPMTVGCISSLFTELSDDQRMELIKSLIWTAPDMYPFHKKAQKMISSNYFQETMD